MQIATAVSLVIGLNAVLIGSILYGIHYYFLWAERKKSLKRNSTYKDFIKNKEVATA